MRESGQADDLGQRVEIGVVARPHGVRGELRVHLYNSESTAFDVVDDVTIEGQSYHIASARSVKGAVLVRFAQVSDRDSAERLCGKSVEVPRAQLQLGDEDELLADFLGCEVRLLDGSPWGEVVEVVAGTQDRLVIHQGEIERYLPLVDAFLIQVDLESKKIIVDPPDELPEWEL